MEEYNLESSEEWTDRRLDKVLSEYLMGTHDRLSRNSLMMV